MYRFLTVRSSVHPGLAVRAGQSRNPVRNGGLNGPGRDATSNLAYGLVLPIGESQPGREYVELKVVARCQPATPRSPELVSDRVVASCLRLTSTVTALERAILTW